MKDTGEPVPETKVVTDWLKTSTRDLLDQSTVRFVTRCCVCLRGAPFTQIKEHCRGDCNLIGSWNKTRANAGYRGLVFEKGSVDAGAKKKQENVDSLKRELDKYKKQTDADIKALAKRVGDLELRGKGKKGGKRKGAPASTATATPEAKKAKKGATTGGKGTSGAETSGSTAAKAGGKSKKGKTVMSAKTSSVTAT